MFYQLWKASGILQVSILILCCTVKNLAYVRYRCLYFRTCIPVGYIPLVHNMNSLMAEQGVSVLQQTH